jgi:outer membrane protein OmpA-like peptidoglycan-associated protein
MKILLIGFLAFSTWSIIATHMYVCKILGLCDDAETTQNVEANLSEAISANTLEMEVAADTFEIALKPKQAVAPKNITLYFAFDKSEFNADSTVEKYLDESKNYLEQNQQALLSLAGHTDATGPDDYNQALGYRRAQRLQHYFENNGVLSQRIILESYGERKPADDNSTKEGRANNRRTVITIKK